MKSSRWNTVWAVILVILFSFYEVSLPLVQSPKLDNVALRIQYLFKFVLIFTEGGVRVCGILMKAKVSEILKVFTSSTAVPKHLFIFTIYFLCDYNRSLFSKHLKKVQSTLIISGGFFDDYNFL